MPWFDEANRTYCNATGVRENASKREALLLGALARDHSRAPRGVARDDEYAAEGDLIRALGYPIGHNFDVREWWEGRYMAVKERRVAAWKSTASASIVGRNMLLQSKYYGSFRYWLFGLNMPSTTVKSCIRSHRRLVGEG